MKVFLLSLISALTVLQASASTKAGEPKARRLLEQALKEDVVIGGAIKRATEMGETCEIQVTSQIHTADGEDHFKASVNCGIPADDVTGGGIVLMLRVEGRQFGDFLDNYDIRVDKAG